MVKDVKLQVLSYGIMIAQTLTEILISYLLIWNDNVSIIVIVKSQTKLSQIAMIAAFGKIRRVCIAFMTLQTSTFIHMTLKISLLKKKLSR